MSLDNFKDDLAKSVFGMTRTEALQKGLCVQCKEPALPKCYSDLGRKEYGISGMCEICFDALFQQVAEPAEEKETN